MKTTITKSNKQPKRLRKQIEKSKALANKDIIADFLFWQRYIYDEDFLCLSDEDAIQLYIESL